jgi:hypothetical protein
VIRSTIRRARRYHRCGCGAGISPGDRYYEHVTPPGGDLGFLKWTRFTECADCAAHYGRPLEFGKPRPVADVNTRGAT